MSSMGWERARSWNLNSACISPKTGWSIIPCTVEGMFGRKRKSMIFTMVPFA